MGQNGARYFESYADLIVSFVDRLFCIVHHFFYRFLLVRLLFVRHSLGAPFVLWVHRRDVQRLGLLRFVRVLGTRIHL